MYKQTSGWILLSLIVSSSIVSTLAYPNYQPPHMMQNSDGFVPSRSPELPSDRVERKFAEKPNAIKKVALDDIEDIQNNQLTETGGGGGFSWSNLLGMVMQMIFNPGQQQGPNKSEGLDDGAVAPSPWANLLTVGLKILTAILGGGVNAGGDGIDKVDNGGGSPMQAVLAAIFSTLIGERNPQQVNAMAKQAGDFLNIVMTLLDALKTSFLPRSMAARNIGKKDSVSDAALAGISMMKGYVKSMNTINSKCMQKFMCDANTECLSDIGQSSIYCHLGSYATSFILDRSTSSSTFDGLYEAGRRGRSGDNCHQAYLECNEV